MENKIQTAEEFFLSKYFSDNIFKKDKELWFKTNSQAQASVEIMQDFAKAHVEAALKAANKYKQMNINGGSVGYLEIEYMEDNKKKIITINENTILNAYPLENIK
jgi:hypothetical protein